jgi:hypothetical protein
VTYARIPAQASAARNGDNTQKVSPKMKTRKTNVATRRARGESILIGMHALSAGQLLKVKQVKPPRFRLARFASASPTD